ncbi:MAG: hypothetical protein ABSA13_10795 [Beijerinckiaceae bacterium]|jgi:hypothetical protein
MKKNTVQSLAGTLAIAGLAGALLAGSVQDASANCVRNSQGGCMRPMTPPPQIIKKKPEPLGCAATPQHCHHH